MLTTEHYWGVNMPKSAMVVEGFPETGFGTYWASLYQALASMTEIDLIYLQYARESPYETVGLKPKVVSGLHPSQSRQLNRLASQSSHGARRITHELHGYPIVHLSTDILSFLLPALNDAITVTTCHDLFTFLETASWPVDLRVSLRRNVRNYANYRSIRHLDESRHVIAVSHSTKRDLVEHLGLPPDRITVVHNGVHHQQFQPSDRRGARSSVGLPQDCFILLNIGTENPRKNIPTLLKIAQYLSERKKNVILLRIGPPTNASRKFIQRNRLESIVRYLPKVPDLRPYYNAADVYVSTSLYEGFGFTVAEAMASGCPVVAANRTATPEVVGDAGILIDEAQDPEPYCLAIDRILSSSTLQDSLSAAAVTQSQRFSWEKCAAETKAVYDQFC
jgi:glycosyltransferase involved in cell wall biosynthesis